MAPSARNWRGLAPPRAAISNTGNIRQQKLGCVVGVEIPRHVAVGLRFAQAFRNSALERAA